MQKPLTENLKTVKDATKTYFSELGNFLTFFVLVVTISILTHKIFGFRLIPVVKTAFDAFHDFCHFIMSVLVFSWLTYFLKSVWYAITWIISRLFPVIPWWPHIIIPPLVTDIALVSLAFTRVFQTADLIIPRNIRENAEKSMTPAQWKQIERVEGRFWGPVHRFLDRTNAGIWKLIDIAQRAITFPFRNSRRYVTLVRRVLITIAGAVFMWGYIRLAGYLINVPAAGHLKSPIMIVRTRFLRNFGLSLLGAIVATAFFFLCNGWVAEWLEP